MVEVKGLDESVPETASGEQVTRYGKRYGYVLVTNYWEFLLVVCGNDGVAHVERHDQAGSACTGRHPEPSYVLRPMGLSTDDDWKVLRCLRDCSDLSNASRLPPATSRLARCWRSLANGKNSTRVASSWATKSRSAPEPTSPKRWPRSKHRSAAHLKTKKMNDFLAGAAAIVDRIRSGKIECRAYGKD